MAWVDIFRWRLSQWRQQHSQNTSHTQPQPAVPSEFVAVFANQVAAARVFELPFLFLCRSRLEWFLLPKPCAKQFVAQHNEDGLRYSVASVSCSTTATILIRHSKPDGARLVGRRFQLLWRLLTERA